MINLIPTHARHHVKVEYWVRVVSVWFVLFGAAALIISVLLIPSLFNIRAQLSAYDGVYETANEKNDVYSALEKKVTSANSIAMQLVDADSGALFTKLITDLEEVAEGRVTVSSISFQREDAVVNSIKVSGNADSRESLVDFRDSLESHTSFESVELPLSNLAKDKDITFSVTIVVSSKIYE